MTDLIALARESGIAHSTTHGAREHVLVATLDQLAAFAARIAKAPEDEWISVDERLPAHRQSVALININQWESTPGDFEMNVRACGYLENWGGLPSHWSVRGERAITLESFTHWMPLPAPSALAATPSPKE